MLIEATSLGPSTVTPSMVKKKLWTPKFLKLAGGALNLLSAQGTNRIYTAEAYTLSLINTQVNISLTSYDLSLYLGVNLTYIISTLEY